MVRPAALAAFCLLLVGCTDPRFGELLLIVDTDARVPEFAARLRLDLYTPEGVWYESREAMARDPAQWPLSFSVYTEDPAGAHSRARLRVFPDGAVRDYRGEPSPSPPAFVEPTIASDLAQLCADAPMLPPYTELTQRRGGKAITRPVPQGDCRAQIPSEAGSVAARVVIRSAARYRFEVVRASPDGSRGILAGDTTLFIRSSCLDPASQIACSDDIDTFQENTLSRIVVDLAPGTYFLLTGGAPPFSPADLTLRWGPDADWVGPTRPIETPTLDEALPRLIRDGVDVTPASEPEPGLSIDRLIDLDVPFGTRRSLAVFLSGECIGTQADLAAGTSCVDTTQVRAPATVGKDALSDLAAPRAQSRVGSWQPERPCTVAPRVGDPELLDEEVCIPGGAFILGSKDFGGGNNGTSPRQVAVVEPFLLDRYEVTVARYRRALADGFVSQYNLPIDLVVNDGGLPGSGPALYCTFSGDAHGPAPGVDRERYPLTCISWREARELCMYLGGDLPSHVEWEYAATRAGRPTKTRYAWGDEPPDCMRARYDRALSGSCASDGDDGPSAVDAEPWHSADRTALGVVGMGGNVSEWALDSMRPYSDPCWWQHTLYGVGCREENPTTYSQRGASWTTWPQTVSAAAILGQASEFPIGSFGFRCARRGTP